MKQQQFLTQLKTELLISKNSPKTIEAYTNSTQKLLTFTPTQKGELPANTQETLEPRTSPAVNEFGIKDNQITGRIDSSQTLLAL